MTRYRFIGGSLDLRTLTDDIPGTSYLVPVRTSDGRELRETYGNRRHVDADTVDMELIKTEDVTEWARKVREKFERDTWRRVMRGISGEVDE